MCGLFGRDHSEYTFLTPAALLLTAIAIGKGSNMAKKYVVAVGPGHNELIAAAFLAKAGKKVRVIERNGFLGLGWQDW